MTMESEFLSFLFCHRPIRQDNPVRHPPTHWAAMTSPAIPALHSKLTIGLCQHLNSPQSAQSVSLRHPSSIFQTLFSSMLVVGKEMDNNDTSLFESSFDHVATTLIATEDIKRPLLEKGSEEMYHGLNHRIFSISTGTHIATSLSVKIRYYSEQGPNQSAVVLIRIASGYTACSDERKVFCCYSVCCM